MKILINGVVYSSENTTVVIEFEDEEQEIFGDMRKFVSMPTGSTEEERQKLLDTPL